jgi:hydantoinase/carbamoylase family amidase
VELHIEQGPVLERSGAAIGAVEAISGSTRLAVVVQGLASHTGGTPMHHRADALAAASACVLAAEALASDSEHHGTRITVGALNVHPSSVTTIPGVVDFSVDIRDTDSVRQRLTAARLAGVFHSIGLGRGVSVAVEEIADTSAVLLPEAIVEATMRVARRRGLTARVLPSGASHDTQMISRITQTGMVFVPSRAGISHAPEEFTAAEEIRAGAQVLFDVLRAFDEPPDAEGVGAEGAGQQAARPGR